MPEIRPFKAYLYHSRLKGQMNELISPPYDVLSEKDRSDLLAKNPYNSVRVCLKAKDETYSDLKKVFEAWKNENVLQKVPSDSLYLIEETFQWAGNTYTRLGFVGLLKVSEFEKKEVFPHEYTLSGPKADRLELLKTLRAEFSQIFFCYEDEAFVLETTHNKLKGSKPEIEATDTQGVRRKLWIVSDPDEISLIQNMLSLKELLIADGHHRYETALKFHQEEASKESAYVQAYFTNRASKGFQILPIHRICPLPKDWTAERLLQQLAQKFLVEKIPVGVEPSSFLSSIQNDRDIQFCIYFSGQQGGFYLKKPKSDELDAEIFSLQKDIFEDLFKWNTAEIAKGHLRFEHDTPSFFESLNSSSGAVGFFLPPTDLDLVMKVVHKGQRMPQKSTFFYPKIASGLVIYELGS